MQSIFKVLLFPFVIIGKMFTLLFGRVNWHMPPWLNYSLHFGKQNPVRFSIACIIIIGVAYLAFKAINYYQSLPEPILVDALITAPITQADIDEELEPLPSLRIQFVYTGSHSPPQDQPSAPPELLRDSNSPSSTMFADFPSVAPMALIGAKVESGIKLSPSKMGSWTWENDRTLVFVPETPWPAGQEYEVSFAPEVFDTKDDFTDYQFNFVTRALTGRVEEAKFEISTEDKLKQVFVEFHFNYPVDKQSVKENLLMAYQAKGNQLGPAEPYTLTFSENLRFATATVAVPELPDQPRIIESILAPGVKSIYGGEASTEVIESKVVVPDLYSYLKVEQLDIDVLRNPENEPEQFVLLGFTDPISQKELTQKLSIFLLPNQSEKNSRQYWGSPREVTNEVLAKSLEVDFELMPTANEFASNYQIKMDVQAGRQLYIKLASGLKSANGFVQKAFFDKILTAPKYPQEVIISGEGSVLTHSKDQRLAFSTRGVSEVQVSIGKVIDDELYHLISQTHGDISNPTFHNWSFNETNLAEFSTQFIVMNDSGLDLKTANYASVDLNGLISSSEGGLGLFFVEIKAWDKNRKREIYGVNDKLLVLVTDLGVIVKTSQDESQDVFVQSIKSGQPIAGASVELIAKNGTTLFSKITDRFGHVTLPNATGFEREKAPVVYVIKRQGDVSFIPYNRYTRQINYSRFDVGGDYTASLNEDRVNAHMFTDRGIYRPGETVNMGMIVKGKNLSNLHNIPLELVVRDAQYTEMYVEKVQLPKLGFFDAKFETKRDFKTGNYTASLHLIRDDTRVPARYVRDRQVGSMSFMLEEFQPDTMSISSQIEDLPNKGWTTSQQLRNKVSLNNLFGVPAQDRKISTELTLVPMQFSFDEFADVEFYLPTSKDGSTDGLEQIKQSLPDQKTNADGQANVPIDLSRFEKGTYRLNVQTKGYEASGGRSVGTSTNFLYSPLAYLLGFKADGKLNFIKKDSERNLQLIAISNELAPLELNNLTMRISRVKSVSTLVKQYNGRYQYESIEKREVISEQGYALPAKYKRVSVNTAEAGAFVMEILNSDASVLLSVEYTVVGASNIGGQLDNDAELKITLNKSDFQNGEEIEVSIQAPYAGSGLLSIESNKLHSFRWFTSATKNSIQRIKLPKGIEGNAYVNVAFVRDVNSKDIFKSPLSYAVAPFSIDRSKRVLDVKLKVEDIVQPGKPMEIGLELGEDAKVVVFAVDLGILQVANYRTPNPLSHFLKKKALSTRTMQILDLILPDFALTRMLSAAGGDREADMAFAAEKILVTGSRMRRSVNPFERQVQAPAVYWSGVVDAQKGNNTYTFDVPNDFAGGLRVMAIAVGEKTMGRAQKTTIARGPFVLTPNVLNQVAPGDEFDITLSVANVLEKSLDNASVDIKVSTSKHLSLVNENHAQMRLSENQEDAVRFRLKANNNVGGATITFDVSTTDKAGKTWQSTRTATLSVRPAMPFEVNITTGVVTDGTVSLDTPLELFAAKSTQMLKASVSPLVITEGLSAYLDEYPHGCTEQIVSQVFPLIGLSNLPKYAPDNDAVASHFNEVISQLRQRQTYSGGFSYWPGAQLNDLNTSLYVMHFLIEAKALGFPVPQDMLQSGIRYLDDTVGANARRSSNNSGKPSMLSLRKRAQAIYLLTRSGVITTNLLIDLLGSLEKQYQSTWRVDLTSAYIASSYALMKQDKEALSLISQYDVSDSDLMLEQAFAGLAPRINLDAQYVFLIAKHFPNQLSSQSGRITEQAIVNITQAIYKGQFNTNSAAYSMLALGAYHAAMGNDNVEAIDKEITFIASTLQQKTQLQSEYTPFASAFYPTGTKRIEANLEASALQSAKTLYYVNLQAGYQSVLSTKASQNGIEVQRAFIASNGEKATKIKQGDELTVRLRVRPTEQNIIRNVAIVDLLPGGFEVIRESIPRESGSPRLGNWQSDYIDIREDRIVFYGDISKQVTDITYKVKVSSAGSFAVPATFAEAMYDRGVNGYSAASSLKVTASEKF